jgi:O-antigen/teichoic acid export membrane protein
VFLLIALCAVPIAAFYDDPRLIAITVAVATSFLWGGVTIQHQALIRRQMAFGTLAVIQLSAGVLSTALAILLAVQGFGYWALVAREVSQSVFLACGVWYAFPWRPGRPTWSREVTSMLFFGRDVTAFNFVWFLAQSFDQILVGKLFGAAALGFYRQGINLVLAPITQLYYPINGVAEAALSRLQHDPAQFRRYYVHLVAAVSSLSMPLAAFLAVFAEEVVLVALGPAWTAAGEFVRILAIAAFVRPATTTAGFVMTSSGHSRRYVWWGTLVALSLVACLVVGASFGAAGLAWGHVAATYLFMLPLLCVGFHGTPVGVREFAAATWRPMIASAIMAAVLQGFGVAGLDAGPAVMLAAGALMAVPAYLIPWLALPGGVAAARDAIADLRSITGQVR